MTYSWTSFFLPDALSGTLVGFQQTNSYDLSCTGILELNSRGNYEVKFKGYTLKVEENGLVSKVTPENASWLNQTLQMVTASMGDTAAVGSTTRRASGASDEHHNDVAVLNNIEPRDQFAVQVLNAMLIHADHPESFDDAKCLMYSRAAYRWAQAMMIAAADSREGESTTPSTTVDVNSGDLQSNTEKLLYNIGEYLKNGVTVKGTTATGTVPVQTKITEMPNVTLNGTPSVNVANTPSVNVANSPSVSVSNMPSEPIEIEGTVTIAEPEPSE